MKLFRLLVVAFIACWTVSISGNNVRGSRKMKSCVVNGEQGEQMLYDGEVRMGLKCRNGALIPEVKSKRSKCIVNDEYGERELHDGETWLGLVCINGQLIPIA